MDRKSLMGGFSNSSSSGNSSSKKQSIKVQQYDNGIKLFFYISKDGFTESIKGAVVRLKFKNNMNGLVLNRTCTITDEELAECLYILTREDLSIVGTYNTEIQVDYANGTILSIENPFTLTVKPENIPNE